MENKYEYSHQPNKTNNTLWGVLVGVGVAILSLLVGTILVTLLCRYFPNILYLVALRIVILPTSIPSLL